ncbi:MAG: type II toxin-antitoxin system RelE/ParE family toxin [Parvibaculum sp.]|nr:type II toxin-antitoxin system RelE/ParE family toxin [Parvibaculum sp.]
MRVFKNKWFGRFARKEGLSDAILFTAAARAGRGDIDADLGGGVIKQRIARRGQGKSGGYRAVILFRRGDKAFFVYGFAKNDRDNIDGEELIHFRKLAREMFGLTDALIARLECEGTLKEVIGDEDV